MKTPKLLRVGYFLFALFMCVASLSKAYASDILPKETALKIQRSVVKVLVTDSSTSEPSRRIATGFVWQNPNTIVTSYHVVAGAKKILVQHLGAGFKVVEANVVAIDLETDLALLRTGDVISNTPLKMANIAPRLGDTLWIAGYPLNVVGLRSRQIRVSEIAPKSLQGALNPTASDELSKLGFPSLNLKVLQLEGDLAPGDSGAPVFNSLGEVVAIGSGGLEDGTVGLGWAIPISNLLKLKPKGNGVTEAINANGLKQVHSLFFKRTEDDIADAILWQTAFQSDRIDAYQDYLNRFPNGKFSSNARSKIDERKKLHSRAYEYYRRAVERDYTEQQLIEISAVHKRQALMKKDLEKAVALLPSFAEAHLELGRLSYLSINNKSPQDVVEIAHRKAIRHFDDAISIRTEIAEAYLLRAFARNSVGDHRHACRDIITFQRLRDFLSPKDFDHYRQNLRFSKEFLEYNGCPIPEDIVFIGPQDLRGEDDSNNVERDCKPTWWEGEALHCAKKGNIEGMIRVCSALRTLSGSVKTLSKEETESIEAAVKWGEELASRGVPSGQHCIANMHWNGVGKAYSPDAAFAIMKRAADKGYAQALDSLAEMYMQGLVGTPQPAAARKAWAKAAVLDPSSRSSLENFEPRNKRQSEAFLMKADFLEIVKRGTGQGYVFQSRPTDFANVLEKAATDYGKGYLIGVAIDFLGLMTASADEITPILVKAYSHLDEYRQQRVRIALKSLGSGGTEASVKLLTDIALSVGFADFEERINLDDNTRVVHEALEALSVSGAAVSTQVDRLKVFLLKKDRQIRIHALAAISQAGNQQATSLIKPLLKDPSNMVRVEAQRILLNSGQ